MRIDLGSLAFNINVNGKIGGTPSWGTAIVYQTVDNKIKEEIAKDILIGMIYKKIDCTSNKLSLPLGKGGHVYYGDEDYATNGAPSIPYLAARFEKTYVNGKYIGSPFILLVMKDGYDAHDGRLQLKYSPKISWGDYSNQEFFDDVFSVLGISKNAPMVCYDISVIDQDQLHFRCAIKDSSYLFKNKYDYNDFINNAIVNDSFTKEEENKSDFPSSDYPLQQIYYGTPGSGKSWEIKRRYEMRKEGDSYVEDEEKKKRVFRTTFHPDTDYAQFVGCYKPIPNAEDEKITYQFVPQTFTDAYVAAWNDPENPYYLIIEEINRGNCAQIFGDLFQLLDRNKSGYSEYPIKADHDLKDYLKKELGEDSEGIKDGKLCLPPNLNIIASMNTSDQSLFPMDSAFKRRWSWEYVPIDYDNTESAKFEITIDGEPHNWHQFLKKVNEKIKQVTSSEDKQMGNFFIKNSVDEKEFCDKVMFYLWSEVGKDNYQTNDAIFKYYQGDEKEPKEFSFNELYDLSRRKELLNGFIRYIEEDK